MVVYEEFSHIKECFISVSGGFFHNFVVAVVVVVLSLFGLGCLVCFLGGVLFWGFFLFVCLFFCFLGFFGHFP